MNFAKGVKDFATDNPLITSVGSKLAQNALMAL